MEPTLDGESQSGVEPPAGTEPPPGAETRTRSELRSQKEARSTSYVWRVTWRVCVLAAGFMVVYLAITAFQVWLTSRRVDAHQAQAIVVMGAAQYNGLPSPDLEARLTAADVLWRQGRAPLVIVTGYKEPKDRFTEAEAGFAWLTAHEVAADSIVEVGGSDSWQELADAAVALRVRGLDNILIVTDGFHEDRSLAIATDLGLRASPVPATGSPIMGWAALPYYAKETLGVGLGRVFGYAHLHVLGAPADLGPPPKGCNEQSPKHRLACGAAHSGVV